MTRELAQAAAGLGLMAVVALCAGTAFAANDKPKPNQVASQICAAEKHADKAAFKATYGKNAMRNCKRLHRDEAEDVIKNASQACRAEEEADPEGFAETYGTNNNLSNAFGKCVSSKAKAKAAEAAEEFKNAAKECRAERDGDPEGFADTYGTNDNRRNAFGKCVSTKVKEPKEAAPTG
jgi:hypothetical protein